MLSGKIKNDLDDYMGRLRGGEMAVYRGDEGVIEPRSAAGV
jgi:hypothetical protein